jgi:hypothetical protein
MVSAADFAKDFAVIDTRGAEPVAKCGANPVRYRNGTNMPSLSDEVHDHPVLFPLPKVFGSQMICDLAVIQGLDSSRLVVSSARNKAAPNIAHRGARDFQRPT